MIYLAVSATTWWFGDRTMSKFLQFFKRLFAREIFKSIENYKGFYEISNFGRVKSLHFGKEKILKVGIGNHGYRMIHLYKNGKRETHNIAHLVWILLVMKNEMVYYCK